MLVTRGEPTKLPLDGPKEYSPGSDPPARISFLMSEGEVPIVGSSEWCLGLVGWLFSYMAGLCSRAKKCRIKLSFGWTETRQVLTAPCTSELRQGMHKCKQSATGRKRLTVCWKCWSVTELVTHGKLTKLPLAAPEEGSSSSNPAAGISSSLSWGSIGTETFIVSQFVLAGCLVFDGDGVLVMLYGHTKKAKSSSILARLKRDKFWQLPVVKH